MEQDNVQLAVGLVGAYVGNNPVSQGDLQGVLKATYETISNLGTPTAPAAPEYQPAVPVKKSVNPDFLVSLVDGRKYKSLKRHLSGHGLTPAQYRERYGLPADYPMVAPNYAKQRSELAKSMGLGQNRKQAAAPTAAPAKAAPAKAAAKATTPKKGAAPKAAPTKTDAAPAGGTPPAGSTGEEMI